VKQASWRRLRRTVAGCLGGLALVLGVLGVLLKYQPVHYRQLAVSGGEDVEALSRRAVTKAAAWHASISRPGGWETALTADEVNAWLAVDLPRNHPRWLPSGVAQPRIGFLPQHVLLGARVGYGPLTAVAAMDFEVVLRDVNHLAIVLDQAHVGAIPLPRAPILRELSRRISRLGMVTDLRRLDGRLVLMVYIPSTHDAGATSYWLESLAFGAGELLLSGETRSTAAKRTSPTPPSS
jgi:hypothetical protein